MFWRLTMIHYIDRCVAHRSDVAAVQTILNATRPVIATVAHKGGGFLADVKQRADVEGWNGTYKNRDRLPGQVSTWRRRLSHG